ncbi:hypothetical protein [Brevundimonas sp. NIBR11]|uniref:hypothetical protein n=1 Tax=Brevundimonas sp. NIBR11 TaxID=3015999 RepID=UPI0022F0A6F0|nr:hypothetical protein [Brevundimonas sp. NIBR11]WGM29903.1 hypothetical protein KKHFBJBL_00116 [Brevundimonas sp. NIBR11]
MKRFECLRPLMVALSLVLGGGTGAMAQSISQPNASFAPTNGGQGQSFTALVTGTVTQIQVRPRTTTGVFQLRFYNGPNGSGIPSNVGTPAYSQPVALVDQNSNSSGFQTIVLTTPFPVTAGSKYSFVFDVGQLAAAADDPYAGGTMILESGAAASALDAAFGVTFAAAPAAAPVPTMMEWTMILFGFMLASGAVAMVQRRRRGA